jgi:phenylalanyl-tRNA synthetase beta chain
MRLLVSWLRDFVDVPASPEEIAGTLGLRGFEVASIEPLDAGDAVIDFEITANRPDCLSVLGLAREVATAYDRPLRLPSTENGARVMLRPAPIGESDRLKVAIDDEERCPRYAAAVADVTIAQSPAWLAARLEAAGVRPISNLVDITNYVLLEIGHPMHAFDLARVGGAELRIRRATPGETLRTLDNVERKLDPDMLVIADANRAQAVAGVMGGAATEVSSATTTVAFESAYFKPVSVRATSKRLGLKTEASARFERGADINAPVVALERALALMEQIGAGRISGPIVDRYPHPRSASSLHLRAARLALLLGATVAPADVERILRSLGLVVRIVPDGWEIRVPTFRVDLLREADLIEEVGRHYGFEKLEPTFPAVIAIAAPSDERIARDRLVRRVLTAAGLSEAVTFGFIEAKAVDTFAPAAGIEEAVAISNPLSAKFDTLRPSLVPGLVDAVAHNRRHGRRDVALFEIGTRFDRRGETRTVALAWTGNAGDEHWSGGARDVDFFDAKGVVEQLAAALHVNIQCEPTREPYLLDGQAGRLTIADGPLAGEAIGLIGVLAPPVVDARGLPRQDRVVVAELDLDQLQAAQSGMDQTTGPLPRYPFVVRDLSIVVADTLPAEIIRGTIQAAGERQKAPLTAIAFFDRYQGKGVPDRSVSLSVRLTFQSPDRTLTDADVQHSFDHILAALVKEHGAKQR